MQTFNNSLNARCLEYRCELCGFDWCAVDEAAATDTCPNCSTPDIAPLLTLPIQLAPVVEEARP